MSNEFAMHVLKEMGEMTSNPDNQKAFEEEMELQKKRRKQLDDLCMQSMEAMGAAMECVQKEMAEGSLSIHQIIDLLEQVAKLGSAMASLRMSMGGIGYAGTSYGYAV